jgi:alpha-aminoadipate carrier protein LysW
MGYELQCPECTAELSIPDDVISGEIISCPDCGMDYEVNITETGSLELSPAEIEGEDWGE